MINVVYIPQASIAYLSRLLSGERLPSRAGPLQKIAPFLGVSVDYLLNGPGEAFVDSGEAFWVGQLDDEARMQKNSRKPDNRRPGGNPLDGL